MLSSPPSIAFPWRTPFCAAGADDAIVSGASKGPAIGASGRTIVSQQTDKEGLPVQCGKMLGIEFVADSAVAISAQLARVSRI